MALSLALSLALVGLAACAPGSREQAHAGLPTVDLSRAAPPVREAVTSARDDVERVRRDGASAEALGRAWGELGETCHAHDFPACALASYAAASSRRPEEARWPMLEGHVLLEIDRAAEAADAFARAATLDAEEAAPAYWHGRAAAAAGRSAEAERAFERALALEPELAAARWSLAQLLLARVDGAEASNLDAAEEHLRAALAAEPAADAVRHALAQVERRRGRPEAAREEARRAGTTRPAEPDALLQELARRRVGVHNLAARAQDEVLAGRLHDAVATYRRLLARAPSDVAARGNLASVLVRLGELDAARAELERVLVEVVGAERAPALYNLGTLELQAGRLDEAASVLERALELAPGHADAALNRGVVAWERADDAGAARWLERSAEADPLRPLVWRWRAVVALRAGRHAEALRLLEEGEGWVDSTELRAEIVRLLATSTDPSVRDVAETSRRADALEAELEAMPPTVAWDAWRSLAFAAASGGHRDTAVRRQRRAVGEATRAGVRAPLDEMRDELALFGEGQAVRLHGWRPLGPVDRAEVVDAGGSGQT